MVEQRAAVVAFLGGRIAVERRRALQWLRLAVTAATMHALLGAVLARDGIGLDALAPAPLSALSAFALRQYVVHVRYEHAAVAALTRVLGELPERPAA